MPSSNNFYVEVMTQRGIAEEFVPREDDDGSQSGPWYVSLQDNTEYKLRLGNNRSTICDAIVKLEGKPVGTWRIEANSSIVIERPISESRKFTFVSEQNPEALEAGISPGSPSNGLVEVEFKPKKQTRYLKVGGDAQMSYVPSPRYETMFFSAGPRAARAASPPRLSQAAFMQPIHGGRGAAPSMYRAPSPSRSDYQGGATVYGSESSQRFTSIAPIPENEIDYSNSRIIMLRLVLPRRTQMRYPIPVSSPVRTRYPAPVSPRSRGRSNPPLYTWDVTEY